MHEREISKHEIARLLDIPRTTVRDDIKWYEETVSNKDRKGFRVEAKGGHFE